MHDLVDKVCDELNLGHNEGRRGVENLCKLCRILGYGDLVAFLEDNSGCVEAIKEWIGDQNVTEWRESLEAEVCDCPDCEELNG